MQIKKKLFYIFLGLFLFQGCNFNSGVTVPVQGQFDNLPDTKIYLCQILPTSRPLIDSVLTDGSGHFKFSVRVKEAGCFTVFHNKKSEINLVITPGETILLRGDGNAFGDSYSVEGSVGSQLYAQYNGLMQINLKKVDSLSAVFADIRTKPGFQAAKNSLDSAYRIIFNAQKEFAFSFVEKNLNSLASLLVISNKFGPNPLLTEQSHPDLFLKLDNVLYITYADNGLVNDFHTRMVALKGAKGEISKLNNLLSPGMQTPEIALPNANGEEILLSSLKGKVVLVYFWSSWNALSRQTNMSLNGIYTQYHKSGFEIMAISIDSDKELWRKAYLLDRAYWVNVNDAKGLESEYCRIYGVKSLPSMILVDKEGKIIARNPDFSELKSLIKSNL